MAKSKRGGSSEIAMLELAARSAPPNANGALAKAKTIIVAARHFIQPVTIKGTTSFAIEAWRSQLCPRAAQRRGTSQRSKVVNELCEILRCAQDDSVRKISAISLVD